MSESDTWIELTGMALGDGVTVFYSHLGVYTHTSESYEDSAGYSAALEDLGYVVETIDLDDDEELPDIDYLEPEDTWVEMQKTLQEWRDNS
jgi:hypothetical protein